MAKKEFDKINTPAGVLSFPSVFVKTAAPGSTKEKWSTVFLIPKSTDITPIKELLKRAIHAKHPNGLPKNADGSAFVSPIKDGNEKSYDGYKDHWFFTASTTNRAPGVVDSEKQAIMEQSEIYAGCHAILSINAYCWEYMGKYGVSIGLQHVLKIKDGTPLSGGSSAEADFANLELPAKNDDAFDSTTGGDLSILD